MAKLAQKRKNNVMLVHALAPYLRDGQATLTLIGLVIEDHPDYLKLQNAINELGVSDKVTIHSNYSFREVRAEYRNHDLFILASEKEGAGISIMEAMSAGLPVICSDDAGLSYLIGDQIGGATFKKNSQDDLSVKAGEFIGNPERIDQEGESAYYKIKTQYSEAIFAQNFERLFHRWFDPQKLGEQQY